MSYRVQPGRNHVVPFLSLDLPKTEDTGNTIVSKIPLLLIVDVVGLSTFNYNITQY